MEKKELLFLRDQIAQVAQILLTQLQGVQIIALSGSLGAGKTTLAIEILRQCGVTQEMQSPTYTYLQMYKNDAGHSFYHFDLYRLQHKDDFLFAGFDEFLYQLHAITIIEWPEIIDSLLDRNVCAITIDYVDDVTRKISWNIK